MRTTAAQILFPHARFTGNSCELKRTHFAAEDRLRCTKKSALPLRALPRSPSTGKSEYMKRKCAHMGAPPLTCRSDFEMVLVFRGNDLLALMLNSFSAHLDFSPPAPKFCSRLQNAINYIKLPPLNVNLSPPPFFMAVFVLKNRDSGKGSSSYPIPDSGQAALD